MNYFLIGYMASGKSTLGKRVARKLDIPFIDMDAVIEKQFNLSVAAIFSTYGEKVFREAETAFLKSLEKSEDVQLISTGGGTPCFHDNISLMNDLGVTVYLKRPAKELAHRIFNSKKSRPLTDDFSEVELISFVKTHLQERESFYNQSEIVMERSEQTTDGILNALLPYSSDFLNKKNR